jgi:hypothetical protein
MAKFPSSLILGWSRCPRPFDWRANPDVETIDWRVRRGKTAHRVRREGKANRRFLPLSIGHERPSHVSADEAAFSFKSGIQSA